LPVKFTANGMVGTTNHSYKLQLQVAGGGFTLNDGIQRELSPDLVRSRLIRLAMISESCSVGQKHKIFFRLVS
jgi:hypothetical protein